MPSILQLLLGGSQAVPVDPFFYSVTSLLHGDGTNGAQNNTFLDSSTNNFTITRNGNTTQGSFSPFSQTGWGNYFDGTGDYLTVADAAGLEIGNEDFTIECWVYLAVGGATQYLISKGTNTDYVPYQIIIDGSNKPNFYSSTNGSSFAASMVSNTAMVLNAWNHIAVCRVGTAVTMYLNGTSVATGTVSGALFDNTRAVGIGGSSSGGQLTTGYLSNVRIVKGTAVYTANFTPPTTPLTAITNTSLLTCQANRFLDASSNAFAITRNGDVSVQPFSPFNPTTAYSTSAVGGSGYFDGSGDYLTAAANSAYALSGDFTIEFWVKTATFDLNTYYRRLLCFGQDAANNPQLLFFNGSAATTNLSVYSDSLLISGNIAVATDAWNHIALCRSGTSLRLFVNGAQSGSTATTSQNFNAGATNGVFIGRYALDGGYLSGYMSGLRILKGTSLYTTTFTPPTSPPSNIANTSLLCNFTNAGIFDNAADADYETVGNAQISTSEKKYGTGSIYLDGTGDWLIAPKNTQFDFGTGDFTVEMWVYPTSVGGGTERFLLDTRATGTDTGLAIYLSTAGVLSVNSNNAVQATGPTVSANVWSFISVNRTAGVLTASINGTSGARASYTSAITAPGSVRVGVKTDGTTPYIGYIDDVRVSKGVGRYPYNFTPPTAEFPNIGGTVTLTADPYFDYTTLLLPGNGTNGAQNNTFLDSSTNNFTITRNGNTTQGTFSPFSQTGWGNFFDGTGDYLSTTANAISGEITFECWVYPTASGVGNIYATSAATQFTVYRTSGNGLGVQSGTSAYLETAGSLLPTNFWTHIAVTKNSSNTFVMYVNGTAAPAATTFGTMSSTYASGTGYVGCAFNVSGFFTGYISNLRFVNGSQVYTANFTPSTTPLTAITNTSLLTCQSNRFVDNSSNAFAITRNGDVSVQAFSPFNPTAAWSAATYGGSGYFDGSGDYLQIANSSAYSLDGDFTIEGWFNGSNYGSTIVFFQLGEVGSSGIEMWVSTASATLRASVAGSSMISSDSMVPSQWTHFALVRSGTGSNNISLYANGKRQAQLSSNNTFTGTANNGIRIGAEYPTATPWNGYLSDIRVLKGTAQYSGTTYTIPTAPLTAVSGTQLLTNFTNAGIYDATSKNDLETVGNAQISTTQSKFGGSSMAFDGSGDYLLGPWNPPTDLGAGDFTIEFWMYPTAAGQSSLTYLFNLATNANYGAILIGQAVSGYGIVLYASSTGSSWNLASGSSFGTATQNAWNHVALTRYGADVRLFLNGIAATTLNWGTTALLTGSSYRPNIGSGGGVANTFYTGYMQDVRMTKGIARYTSNFTPPTTAFLTL